MTLTGVIFNALMQGYVGANSIYVYLIENIENEPLDFSHSAFVEPKQIADCESSGIQTQATLEARHDNELTQSVNQARGFHQARMHSVLTNIAEQKRKQLKL